MRDRGHLLVAFAAMIFVGASWGANVPVSKVMLAHFDLIPMSAIRTAVAGVGAGRCCCCWSRGRRRCASTSDFAASRCSA